jgi:hypothetical protein
VKCDEAYPTCHACVSTGRRCDGYALNRAAHPDLSNASLGAMNRPPSVGFLGDEKECRSFHFFRLKTAPQLTGFFGVDVWERLLIQAALHEPSIRHATLALGSLHRKLECDDGSIVLSHTNGLTDAFALRSYNQAINLLVTTFSEKRRPAIDVCLILSILFACLEVSCSCGQIAFLIIINRQCKVITAPLSHTSKAA